MHLLGKIKQFEGVHEMRGDPFEVGTVYIAKLILLVQTANFTSAIMYHTKGLVTTIN